MKNTLSVTTFNILNNPQDKEERVEVMFKEINEHGSDVVLLQEVLEETLPFIKEKAAQEGWFIAVGDTATYPHAVPTKKISGNVTLSRIPIESSMTLPNPEDRIYVPTLITHLENDTTVINAHLVWGGDAEQLRVEMAYRINQYAECLRSQEPDRLIVFGGDFNATLNSSTIHYLNGNFFYKDSSTVWTSAWHYAESIFPTARKDGGWAERTALNAGIMRPDLMPERTIDHILVYGWNYGKKHCPVEMKRFGEFELSNGDGLSDHYGITASITR